jgi:hypothetical protein
MGMETIAMTVLVDSEKKLSEKKKSPPGGVQILFDK